MRELLKEYRQVLNAVDDCGSCGSVVLVNIGENLVDFSERSQTSEPSCTVAIKDGGDGIVVGQPPLPHFHQAALDGFSLIVA